MQGVPLADLEQFPVEMVSWDDTQRFLERLNERCRVADWVYRLPTQIEWEYASTATSGRIWPRQPNVAPTSSAGGATRAAPTRNRSAPVADPGWLPWGVSAAGCAGEQNRCASNHREARSNGTITCAKSLAIVACASTPWVGRSPCNRSIHHHHRFHFPRAERRTCGADTSSPRSSITDSWKTNGRSIGSFAVTCPSLMSAETDFHSASATRLRRGHSRVGLTSVSPCLPACSSPARQTCSRV